MSSPRTLYDHTGRSWLLEHQLAEGGEGTVHTVVGDTSLLAKIYKKPPSAQTADKLRWMVAATCPRELRQLAAWPGATLHEAPRGPVLGYLMPRFIDYRPLQNLYNPAQRLTYFPEADWFTLMHAAKNCAAGFAAVHANRCLVGDVNEGNLLVSKQALVVLIDCDSFQVDAGGKVLLCEVGVPLYTPPELQGGTFRGVVRTPNQDNFGLAVLMFQLLFTGRHPYAGRYLDRGEMPLERAIKEGRFAYGRSAAALRMDSPPHTPSLEYVSPDLRTLFERAFAAGAATAGNRPEPAEWYSCIDAFQKQLRACTADPGHRVPAHLAECPWCAIVRTGGPNYFRGSRGATVFALDRARLEGLWRQIVGSVPAALFAYSRPPAPPANKVAPRAVPAEAITARFTSRLVGWVAAASLVAIPTWLISSALGFFGLLATLVFGGWWGFLQNFSAYGRERRQRTLDHRRAGDELTATEAHHRRRISEHAGTVQALYSSLEGVRSQWEGLQGGYKAEREELERRRMDLAREQFLRSLFLTDADIPNIGPSRKQMLTSFGIETALEVERQRILSIRGFGEKLTESLLEWKATVVAKFRFDPATGIPETVLGELALKYRQAQDSLRSQLEDGVRALQREADELAKEGRAIAPRIVRQVAELAQAEANLKVLASP